MAFEVTPGECLRLWRYRTGMHRGQAAARYRLTVRQWQYLEGGCRPDEARTLLGRLRPRFGPSLLPPEISVVCRWRSGMETGAVAGCLGISRVTLAKWEQNGNARLLKFWREMGVYR